MVTVPPSVAVLTLYPQLETLQLRFILTPSLVPAVAGVQVTVKLLFFTELALAVGALIATAWGKVIEEVKEVPSFLENTTW